MKNIDILTTLLNDRDEILTNLKSHGLTEIKLLVDEEMLLVTYNYQIAEDKKLEEDGAKNFLYEKLGLTEEEISNDRVLLLDISDEILTDRQKEDSVEYSVEELEELMNNEKLKNEVSTEEVGEKAKIEDDKESIESNLSEDEKTSVNKRTKEDIYGNSPSASPARKETKTEIEVLEPAEKLIDNDLKDTTPSL